jgi:hypothetical protein
LEGMRKFRLLFFCAAFFLGTSLSAETAQKKNLAFTLLGGFSFTNHLSSGLGSVDGTTGMCFGFGLDYRLSRDLVLEIDMLDVWKSYEDRTANTVTKYNLSFLQFPFLLKYEVSSWFALKGGPYLAAFMIEAERETAGTASSVKGDFKNDFGMTVGAAMSFQASKRLAAGLDVRYDFGFQNILNDRQPTRNLKTRTLLTLFTITISLK